MGYRSFVAHRWRDARIERNTSMDIGATSMTRHSEGEWSMPTRNFASRGSCMSSDPALTSRRSSDQVLCEPYPSRLSPRRSLGSWAQSESARLGSGEYANRPRRGRTSEPSDLPKQGTKASRTQFADADWTPWACQHFANLRAICWSCWLTWGAIRSCGLTEVTSVGRSQMRPKIPRRAGLLIRRSWVRDPPGPPSLEARSHRSSQ